MSIRPALCAALFFALLSCRSASEYVPAEGALGPYSAAAKAGGLSLIHI